VAFWPNPAAIETVAYLLLYTSVLKYFRPESPIRVTTLAPGPSRPLFESGHLNRGDDVCSGRRPRRLLPRQAPRHLLRVVCSYGDDVFHESRLPKWRSVANPNSFDIRGRRASRLPLATLCHAFGVKSARGSYKGDLNQLKLTSQIRGRLRPIMWIFSQGIHDGR
jgi:hypothetical protein